MTEHESEIESCAKVLRDGLFPAGVTSTFVTHEDLLASREGGGDAGPRKAPHPFVWTVLYLPFGALGGFVTVALTFLATKHGLSISEGALLNGAQLGTQWMKWLWAPIVDVTLTPRKWYVLSTA